MPNFGKGIYPMILGESNVRIRFILRRCADLFEYTRLCSIFGLRQLN